METKKHKIVTIGGRSSCTPELIEDFIGRYDTLPVWESGWSMWRKGVANWKPWERSLSVWYEKQAFPYSPLKKIAELCNVPIHMEKDIARRLGIDASCVWVKFGGLNHMVYALNVFLDGKDVTKEALA